MGFADNLKRNIQGALTEVSNKITERAILVFSKAVDFSPLQDDAIYPGAYAKGLFANSWYPAIDEFDTTVGTIADESASGSRARIENLRNKGAFLGRDGFISLSNSLSYALRVELLGWPKEDGYSGFIGPYAPARQAILTFKGVGFK